RPQHTRLRGDHPDVQREGFVFRERQTRSGWARLTRSCGASRLWQRCVEWWVPVEEFGRASGVSSLLSERHAPGVLLPERRQASELGGATARAEPQPTWFREVINQRLRQPTVTKRAQIGEPDTQVAVRRA